VPRVEGGAICIADGRYSNPNRPYGDTYYTDSQCYEIGTGVMNTPNVDLGLLPQPWHDGGDAWQELEGQYEVWGIQRYYSHTTSSRYASEAQPFTLGPSTPHAFLSVDADNYNGMIWASNDSTGGYWSSNLQESLRECPVETDTDGDGVPHDVDHCPTTPNPDQADSDGDGDGVEDG